MSQFLLSLSQFPFAPLAVPLLLPLVPLSTYLAPSSCDRNRPPPSQVACKLTLFAPPFTQLSHPFQLPRTPTAQRLTMTTLGPFCSCYAEQEDPPTTTTTEYPGRYTYYYYYYLRYQDNLHLQSWKLREVSFQELMITYKKYPLPPAHLRYIATTENNIIVLEP
jgi:hypothetical protein